MVFKPKNITKVVINLFCGLRKSLLGVLFVLVVFVVSLISCVLVVRAQDGVNPKIEPFSYRYADFNVKTTLQNGDMKKALCYDLLSVYKELATGKVSQDRFVWSFEKAPFYVDENSEWLSFQNMRNFTRLYCNRLDIFLENINEDSIGLFHLRDFECTTETRAIKGPDGDTFYRSALVGICVKSWCTPAGIVCSRQVALDYYGKVQKRIESIVSKVLATRLSNGKSLSIPQRLKWIHDYLAISVEYDKDGLVAWVDGDTRYNALFNECGPLLDGKAVCVGYAYAYCAIVNALAKRTSANLAAEIVSGSNHTWNRVKINNKWYHIDVTFDDLDSESGRSYRDDYFLISDYELPHSHLGVEDGYFAKNLQKATDTRYDFKEWPVFFKTKISGIAKSTKKYKLGKKKAVRPFDVCFCPFARTYKYSKMSTSLLLDKSKGLVLVRGVDYGVKYRNCKKKGWATAVITLKGEYKGKIKIKYKIVQ